jgi:hypothetical protein
MLVLAWLCPVLPRCFHNCGTNTNGAGLKSLRHLNFSIYIQNIKLGGGNWTFSKKYISLRMYDLEKKWA